MSLSETSPSTYTNGYEFSQGTGYSLPEYATVVPPAVQSGKVEHHCIIIVGGGLAGLTLACGLAQLGVRAVLLDEDNTVGVKGASSRGICYTQKSLEIFDKLGIYPRIKAKGIEWSVGRTFAGEDEIYRFDLKSQNNFSLSQQPAFINIQQFYNEGYLVERIAQLNANSPHGGVEIRWGNRVKSFSKESGLATFNIATSAGQYCATADYVIDATGSRSPFRDWLGVEVTAKKGDDRWCIADVRFNTQPPTERHTWIEAPFNDNRAVWQHLMADQVWRIDYQMAPDADAAYVSREDVVRERLEKQFGKDVKVDIVWVGPYAYRSECVSRMAVDLGRSTVFLMGDSAKVVSPFGARGGNTGIADADNLAWKLAAVVQGRAAPALLESYHAERHEAATTNVLVTNRTARFLRPAEGAEKLFRSATIALAKKYPFARALVNTGRMAVANPYSTSPLTDPALAVSHSVQNVGFSWTDGHARGHSDGHSGCLNDLLRWAGARTLLLVWGNAQGQLAASASAATGAATGARVGARVGARAGAGALPQLQKLCAAASAHDAIRVVGVWPTPESAKLGRVRESVVDSKGLLAHACGLRPAKPGAMRWALLRPDSYLAAQGQGVDATLMAALARCAGTILSGAHDA